MFDRSIIIEPLADQTDKIIQQQKLSAEIDDKEILEELINKGESDTLEFKSSMKTPVQPDLTIISIEKLVEKAVGQEKNTLQKKLEETRKNLIEFLEHVYITNNKLKTEIILYSNSEIRYMLAK
jgi:hypothetical protein